MVMLSNVCQPQKSSSKVQGASAKEQQKSYLQGPENTGNTSSHCLSLYVRTLIGAYSLASLKSLLYNFISSSHVPKLGLSKMFTVLLTPRPFVYF